MVVSNQHDVLASLGDFEHIVSFSGNCCIAFVPFILFSSFATSLQGSGFTFADGSDIVNCGQRYGRQGVHGNGEGNRCAFAALAIVGVSRSYGEDNGL